MENKIKWNSLKMEMKVAKSKMNKSKSIQEKKRIWFTIAWFIRISKQLSLSSFFNLKFYFYKINRLHHSNH